MIFWAFLCYATSFDPLRSISDKMRTFAFWVCDSTSHYRRDILCYEGCYLLLHRYLLVQPTICECQLTSDGGICGCILCIHWSLSLTRPPFLPLAVSARMLAFMVAISSVTSRYSLEKARDIFPKSQVSSLLSGSIFHLFPPCFWGDFYWGNFACFRGFKQSFLGVF